MPWPAGILTTLQPPEAGCWVLCWGKARVEKAFNRGFASQFNIHRSRQKFPDNGIDNFSAMAEKGIYIIDRVVQEQLKGGVDLKKDVWYMRGR